MKATTKLVLLIALLAALAFPQTALAQGPSGDKFVFGGTYTLAKGETLNGNLFVFGGLATLEDGSTVTGDVMLAGGNLKVLGTIEGNIVATGGLVDLRESAIVHGDVTAIAANLEQQPGARVDGQINTGVRGPFQITVPGSFNAPAFQVNRNPILELFWYFTRSFLWAALAILVVLFLPHNTERATQAAVRQPLIAGGLGLLTVIVFPLLLVVVAITLIGIPVSVLGAMLLVVTWSYGVVIVGTEVGRRLSQLVKQDWAPALAAGVGTFLLTLVTNGINAAVPCVGWVAPAVVGMLGLGAVLLTRYGTQAYPPYLPAAASGPSDWPPSVPPAPAEPPAAPTQPSTEEPPPSE